MQFFNLYEQGKFNISPSVVEMEIPVNMNIQDVIDALTADTEGAIHYSLSTNPSEDACTTSVGTLYIQKEDVIYNFTRTSEDETTHITF